MTNRVTLIFAAICSVLAASGSTFAADMPVKAAPLQSDAPAVVYSSWTGWYIGGNVGYGWGGSTDIASNNAVTIKTASGAFVNGPFPFGTSSSPVFQGVIGGGQIGYNYQISPRWVLGFETDIQASGERAPKTLTAPFSGPICVNSLLNGGLCTGVPMVPPVFRTLSGIAVTSEEAKIGWFGTVRGRVGYLLNDGLLLYGTGGLAYGQTSVSGNVTVSASQPGNIPTPPVVTMASTFGPTTSFFGQSRTNIGFAAGAGLEGRFFSWLPPGWTWKVEYLFVDLGSVDTLTSFSAVSTPTQLVAVGGNLIPLLTPLAGAMTTHTHFTDNVVRVGLNYQFH